MTCLDYLYYNFCITCRLQLPKLMIRCPECGRKVRYKAHTYRGRKHIPSRYGIVFIPTAIIVCSNLYNIVFI